MNLILYSRCLRCNKPLKGVKAQQCGYGEHCLKLIQLEKLRNQKTLFDKIK